MTEAYSYVIVAALCVLGVAMFACLFRAVKGPTTADRVIAVNMTGTVTIFMILLLTLLLNEGYLADIAIIYALLSFLSVLLLVRIFVALNRKRAGKDNRNA